MSLRRRRLRLIPFVLALFALGAGVWALASSSGADRSTRGSPRAASKPARARRAAPPVDAFAWPVYGYSLDHQRYFAASLRPPFRRRWTFDSGGLLEFPPVIARGRLYQLNDNAVLNALDKDSGRPLWNRKLGVLSASTPAVGDGAVYATVLDRGSGAGRAAALRASDGHLLWQRDLPSASESSPLLHDGVLYFGTQGGTVYALRARDGSVLWTYTASGSVKGSPTYHDGVLYFGDYGDQVHAVSARTGASIWNASGSDSFYATAAVAFGRVYIGNTSGQMYAFDARTGSTVWARGTGNDIYASAAALDAPGVGPTIYLGSYDGTFYALDAASGATRWTHDAGGRISGSSTIVGDIVYFANLAALSTTGLDVRDGHVVFQFDHGSFDPAISDGRRLYLTGQNSITALDPASSAAAANDPAGPLIGASVP